MNASGFDMRRLLEAAGFRIRGATRADCVHCDGNSRGTVSFTAELAFCHRCKWTANAQKLARQIVLPCGNPHAASAYREEARRRAGIEGKIKRFAAWQDVRIREVSGRHRLLSKAAIRASNVLAMFPTCDDAWGALASFYHAEARLRACFDWLMFTKVSVWLENDSSPVEVFESWRSNAA
jgi:hypothetical protein